MSAVAETRWRWTVDAYELAGAAGVFDPDVRVELLEGEVVTVSPMLPGHANGVRGLCEAAYDLDRSRWTVGSQLPVQIPPDSEPEPDLWIAIGPRATYDGRHPRPSDLVLVVEVSDSSLSIDRNVKVPLYASAGVPEVWLVSLSEATLTVYRQPDPARRRFDDVSVLHPPDVVVHGPSGLTVPVDHLC